MSTAWYRYWQRAEPAPSAAQDGHEAMADSTAVPTAVEHPAEPRGGAPFHVELRAGAPGTFLDPSAAAAPETTPADARSEALTTARGDAPLHAPVGPPADTVVDVPPDAPPTRPVGGEHGPGGPAATAADVPSDAPTTPPVAGEHVPGPFHVKRPADAGSVRNAACPRFGRAHVVVIANQKGGVGKTTTAVSLAAALAEYGVRTLLVDLDPQANATSGVGLRTRAGQATVYDVLVGGQDLEDAVEPTTMRNLFVVPASLDLAGAEIELVSAFSREQKLRRALDTVRDAYDVVVVDCPPSLGLLTVNALAAADGIIVPIQCEYYALEGLGALRRNADLVQQNLNPEMHVIGYVMTMLDARTRLGQQVVDEVRAHFGDKVFRTQIPRSVRLAEAPSYGQPITVFDPSSRGARAYRRLAREVLERVEAATQATAQP